MMSIGNMNVLKVSIMTPYISSHGTAPQVLAEPMV